MAYPTLLHTLLIGNDTPAWNIYTSNVTAVNNAGILANTSAGPFTVTLPASPSLGSTVTIYDDIGYFGINNVTISGSSLKIEGTTNNYICDISYGYYQLVYCDVTTRGWGIFNFGTTQQSKYPKGHIQGLTLSNNSTNPNSQINVMSGSCADTSGSYNINLLSSFTKTITGTWVVGSEKNGLDSGTKTNSTWYNVFTIYNPIKKITDVLFSNYLSGGPILPTGYAANRRIGSVFINSSGNIQQFYQYGDYFYWNTSVVDAANGNGNSVLVLISTPVGFNCAAIQTLTSNTGHSLFTHGAINVPAVGDMATLNNHAGSPATVALGSSMAGNNMVSDTGSSVRFDQNSVNTSYGICTHGYIDVRGKT